ncbi:PREDICTED: interleukin-24 [Elephantulus edwardii]|uniref:interleukin-24 n=1 Tax=Elephantulus edwardii TaxID=28737 RepID=UPI0003F09A9A|nr:PREDICTED: interleukin-24 [Elephantulus edwardii]
MASWMCKATLPFLSVFLILWSQMPEVQGQEFRFGPCRVQEAEVRELRKAFWTLKDTVQAQDHNTNVRLLRKEILQNVSDAESCYFIHSLLKFYLKTVLKNFYSKAAELRILPSFSALTNNIMILAMKLQRSEGGEKFSNTENAQSQFLQFRKAFKQMDREAALIKAVGEFDILLTWMEKFYQH